MKIGIFSDLHNEFTDVGDKKWEIPDSSLADVWINAGDTDTTIEGRRSFNEKNAHPLTILGNHDFWYQKPREVERSKLYWNKDGVSFAGATLWTGFPSHNWDLWCSHLMDWRMMRMWLYDISWDLMQEWYHEDKEYLLNVGGDVIISHHLPSFRSVHPKYAGSSINFGFATELEEEILSMAKPPKLWIHGHTHTPCDYMIGETRVICHPRGYPFEGGFERWMNYKPLVIEI